jgi:uncharacterized membrane protein YGL010W
MFHRYSEFHRNGTNKAIHWVCVPLILWSVIGLLWVASPILTGVAIAASWHSIYGSRGRSRSGWPRSSD